MDRRLEVLSLKTSEVKTTMLHKKHSRNLAQTKWLEGLQEAAGLEVRATTAAQCVGDVSDGNRRCRTCWLALTDVMLIQPAVTIGAAHEFGLGETGKLEYGEAQNCILTDRRITKELACLPPVK